MDTDNISRRGVDIDGITARGLKSEPALSHFYLCPSVFIRGPGLCRGPTANRTGRNVSISTGMAYGSNGSERPGFASIPRDKREVTS